MHDRYSQPEVDAARRFIEKALKTVVVGKLPGELRVIGDDITHKYLLLSNGHDGRSAVHVTFTPVRVVCRNTRNLARQGGDQRRALRIPHTRDMRERLARVDRLMGIGGAGLSAEQRYLRRRQAVGRRRGPMRR